MKKTLAVLAAIVIGITAQAADVVVDIGSVTIKSAAVPKVKEFLATKAEYRTVVVVYNTYSNDEGTYVLTNDVSEVDEMVSTTSRRVREEIPEGVVPRLKRLIIQGGWYPLKAEYIEWCRQQAIAEIPAEDDPESE